MNVAKAKGRLRGKQPKLSPTQEAHLVKLYRAGARKLETLEGDHRAIRRAEASKPGGAGE